jgi:hypothetical protein
MRNELDLHDVSSPTRSLGVFPRLLGDGFPPYGQQGIKNWGCRQDFYWLSNGVGLSR